MNLFQTGAFKLHSGELSSFKIECDALTDDDLDTIAFLMAERLPKFKEVHAIPEGGVRLAQCLNEYREVESTIHLIVDDVLTSGNSMTDKWVEVYVAGAKVKDILGTVIFARSKCPRWITPLFRMPEA